MWDTIIFDMDGTLIDTEKYYRRCWPLAAAACGFSMSDEEALSLRSLGRPFAPLRLKEMLGEDLDYEALRQVRNGLLEECIEKEGISPKKGVRELLHFLRAKGVRIAIATATDPERARRYLKLAGLDGEFETIISATMVKEGKPSPEIYRYACDRLSRAPGDCFVVEDSPNGVRSAYEAGCKVILVPDQTPMEEELEDMVYGQVESLEAIIGLWEKEKHMESEHVYK